jgi:DNA-binding response OmpR family regulator
MEKPLRCRNSEVLGTLRRWAGGLVQVGLPMRSHCYPELEGKRILVVEDDVVVAVDYCFQLRQVGAKPEAYEPTSKAALAYLSTHQVDAVIVDYELRDGPCDAVLSSLRRCKIPFIVVSGHTHRMEEIAGGSTCLAKPVAPAELWCALSELLH